MTHNDNFQTFLDASWHRIPGAFAALAAAPILLVTGCGAPSSADSEWESSSVEPPSPERSERESSSGGSQTPEGSTPGPNDPADAAGILGVVLDETEARLSGATVCADADYVTHCGQTDSLGRYQLEPIIGFDSANIVFLAEDHPPARVRVPLRDGSAWHYAKLPSDDELARFNEGLQAADAIGLGSVLVRIQRDGSMDGQQVALAARHTSPVQEPTDSAKLTVLYEADDGTANPALSGTASALAGITVREPAWIALSVDPEGPCRFRGGLSTATTVITHPDALTLVDLACAEGLRGL